MQIVSQPPLMAPAIRTSNLLLQDGANVYGFEASSGLTSRLHPAAHAQLTADDVAIWQSAASSRPLDAAAAFHMRLGLATFSSPPVGKYITRAAHMTAAWACAVSHHCVSVAELMMAIMTVPWPISTEFPEDCRYNTLLQISVGQVRKAVLTDSSCAARFLGAAGPRGGSWQRIHVDSAGTPAGLVHCFPDINIISRNLQFHDSFSFIAIRRRRQTTS